MVAYGNKSYSRCYDVDKECSQGDAKPIGEAPLMGSTIEGKESSKVLIQINVGSKSNSIAQNCDCVH